MAFDDYDDSSFGSLGGSGAEGLDRVSVQTDTDGVHARCNCANCNRPNEIICPWTEVICGSLEYVLPNWRKDQPTGLIYPFVGCAACRTQITIGYTPNELAGYVKSAIHKNQLSQQWVAAEIQQIKAQAGR